MRNNADADKPHVYSNFYDKSGDVVREKEISSGKEITYLYV